MMSGKIIGSNGDVLFEFEEDLNLEILLATVIQIAKFKEPFDNIMLANNWVNQLLDALIQAYPEYMSDWNKEGSYSGAPDSFLDDGMTQSDWHHRDIFHAITYHLSPIT